MIWWLLGCAAEPVQLTVPRAWEPVIDEPFDDRPADDACPSAAWGPEDGSFEVQTGACAYAAFAQPLPVDLRPGDHVVGDLWHADLDAPEATSAHVAIWAGDAVLWERDVPIPGPAWAWAIDVVVDARIEAGEPLGLHLHNHGFNSWNVGTFWRE